MDSTVLPRVLTLRRCLVVLASLLTTISLGYNALWVLAAPSVVAMTCLADYAGIQESMLSSRAAGDWDRVSRLLPYLREYEPQAVGGCIDRQPVENPWILPLQALALRAQLARVDRAKAAVGHRRYLETICREAAIHTRHATTSSQAIDACESVPTYPTSVTASDPSRDRSP